jgi:hypothetical protein
MPADGCFASVSRRRAAVVENDALRVTVLEEGGHIAEIFDKRSGVNPLWTPPWPSIEPSTYSPSRHGEYGDGSDAILLAGIMGHNLCLDIFGGPSDAEAAAGLTPHGEASVVRYELSVAGTIDDDGCRSADAGLRVGTRDRAGGSGGEDSRERRESDRVRSADRLDPARHARPAVPRERAHRVPHLRDAIESVRTVVRRRRRPRRRGALRWPLAPRADGGVTDLRRFTDAPRRAPTPRI